MAKSKSTGSRQVSRATSAAMSPELSDELDTIQDELLDLVHHFQLADQRLWGDLQGVPEELQAAAVVLHRATDALDALHNRLDLCNVRLADLRKGPGWRERLQADMHPTEECRQ